MYSDRVSYVWNFCVSMLCHRKYGEWQIFYANIHKQSKARQLFLLFVYSLSLHSHKKVLLFLHRSVSLQCRFSVCLCAGCVFFSLWSSYCHVIHWYLFFRVKVCFFPFLWDVNQTDRVKNWYSFCFSCSVFDKNINCRKVLWKIYEIRNFVWIYWSYSLVLRIDVVLRWSDCF